MNLINDLVNRFFPYMTKNSYFKLFARILIISLLWLILCKAGYVIGQDLYYATH